MLALLDGLDLGSIQGTTHDQPHAATVADQPFDSARCERQTRPH